MSFADKAILRRASPSDANALETFLARHPKTSMFLRSNLAAHGTEETDHPHGTTFWMHTGADGPNGVLGITNAGFLMAQAPEAAPGFWRAGAGILAGRQVVGMTGVPAQVAACLDALGLSAQPMREDSVDPLYELDLGRLAPINAPVRRARPKDLSLLEQWFAAYEVDVKQALPGAPPSEASRARAAAAVDSADVALFELGDRPVAMARINARLPDIVQIGGVYTPPEERGRGHARRALAGLLRWCRDAGVRRSVLFAYSPLAVRAYEALGYQHTGDYRVALLAEPTVIGGCA